MIHQHVGMDLFQQPIYHGAILPDDYLSYNQAVLRKRSRNFLSSTPLDAYHKSCAPIIDYQAGCLPDVVPLENTSLNPPLPSPTGRSKIEAVALLSTLRKELESHFLKQDDEIEQLIKIQGERMKQCLEQKKQMQVRAMLLAIEGGVRKAIKSKEEELKKARNNNVLLEETVRKLRQEAELWQEFALKSEMMAMDLRSRLDSVVMQIREGSGESEDATSACHSQEEKEIHRDERLSCKLCKSNQVCILLLPCRHLCLCKACEGLLDVCPLCQKTKSASIQVYLS